MLGEGDSRKTDRSDIFFMQKTRNSALIEFNLDVSHVEMLRRNEFQRRKASKLTKNLPGIIFFILNEFTHLIDFVQLYLKVGSLKVIELMKMVSLEISHPPMCDGHKRRKVGPCWII